MTDTNPKFIYLQPECCADQSTGRLWCEDPDPEDCEEGKPWVEYVRSDVAHDDWLPIKTLTCDDGPVHLYSKEWIDPDFNPKGIREGHRYEDDNGPIASAKWNSCQDCWDTVEDGLATHWRPFREPPAQERDDG